MKLDVKWLPVAVLCCLQASPADARSVKLIPASVQDHANMRAAIQAHEAVKGGPCAQFGLQVRREVKGFAVGTLTCTATDDATVILKRAGKGWQVVVIGTGLPAWELRKMGVPAEIVKDFE